MAGLSDEWKKRKEELEDSDGSPQGGAGLSVAAIVGGAVILLAILFALLILLAPRPAEAQELADFDYENLSFRGVAADVGYIFPNRVEATNSFGARVDLGFLGPGVRVTTGFNRWSSFLKASEVRTLENQLEELIFEQTGQETSVDLGEISWSDVAFNADAHMVWRVPGGLLTYAGLGGTAHILRGGGRAIEDTFIEDLLDSVRAGMNIHGGVEAPVHERLRFVGEARFEVLENLRYLQLRTGVQLMFGGNGTGPR
jgi:hypothetical protein